MVQDLIVGLIVAFALGVVLFRVVRALRPAPGASACPSCASGEACADTPARAAASVTPGSDVQPLILMRQKPR